MPEMWRRFHSGRGPTGDPKNAWWSSLMVVKKEGISVFTVDEGLTEMQKKQY
jgi:hypothetical protein